MATEINHEINAKTEKQTARKTFRAAFKGRQEFAMLLLGFASGLPYVVVAGVLNAWLTTAGVKPIAIGLLSWVTLAYTFKYMWAATLQSHRTPFKLNIGPRRFWMFVFLTLNVIGLMVLSFAKPPNELVFIGVVGLIIAVFSASFDIVQAAWKIEIAESDRHLDLLCAIEQLGYRLTSFVVGAGALILADYIGWQPTFIATAVVLGLCIFGVVLARPSPVANSTLTQQTHEFTLASTHKKLGVLAVLVSWGLAFIILGRFMFAALADPIANSPKAFLKEMDKAPAVVFLTVIMLGFVAAILLQLQDRNANKVKTKPTGVVDILYVALLVPMMDLISRLRWGALLILVLVLSYRFTDLIWGGFAYPFYMGTHYGALGHSLTEVGLASKTIGVFATMLGIGLGGLAMMKYGRMPVMLVGGIFAALTNLLFADLALGAHFMDGFLCFTQLDHVFGFFNIGLPLARLIAAIFAENVAVGVASAASVAFLSSIVNKRYAVIQYALIASLTFLIGILGRPAIGQIIETEGFARAFIVCAWLGSFAVIFTVLEWIRQSAVKKREKLNG